MPGLFLLVFITILVVYKIALGMAELFGYRRNLEKNQHKTRTKNTNK